MSSCFVIAKIQSVPFGSRFAQSRALFTRGPAQLGGSGSRTIVGAAAPASSVRRVHHAIKQGLLAVAIVVSQNVLDLGVWPIEASGCRAAFGLQPYAFVRRSLVNPSIRFISFQSLCLVSGCFWGVYPARGFKPTFGAYDGKAQRPIASSRTF